MVDPLAVYGAIGLSIDLLGKIYRAVSRYMELPEALATIQSRMLSCGHAWDKWKDDFRILDEEIPERFYQVLWGKTGYQEVLKILIRLGDTRKKVWRYVDDMIVTAVRYDRKDVYGAYFDRQLQTEIASAYTNWFSWKRFIGAIVDRSRKLTEDIASFNEDLQALQRTSNYFINKLYGVDLERGASFNEVMHSGLSCRATRKHAEIIHNAFIISKPNTYLALIPLKMSPHQRSRTTLVRSARNRSRNKIRDVDENKDFQFLLQRNAIWIPVWFRPANYSGNPTFCSSFSQMIDQIALEGSCNLKPPQGSREKSRTKGYRVREYDQVFLKSFNNIRPLKQQLRSMWPREKVQVAYAIASGFYRVVGSTWGNYFECANIRAKSITTNEWAVALQAQEGDPRLSNILDVSQMIHHRPGKKMAYHCQVYRLGVILAEIALGRPAGFVELHKDYGPLLVTDGRGPRDAAEIANETISVMGPEYGNAVFFCLSLFEKPDELKKDGLDYEFEQEVLIP